MTDAGAQTGPQEVLTAGAATAIALSEIQPPLCQVLVVGPPALRSELHAQGISLFSNEGPCDAVVVAAHDGFDFAELRKAATAVRRGAGLFATGRDAVYPTADGLCPATGAVLAAIETASGQTATIIGKPEPPMFELARKQLGDCTPIAVVGDHIVADIAGAKRAGLAAILTLSGVTTRADLHDATTQPDLVVDDLLSLATLIETPTPTTHDIDG
jgi:HAD superfamily hydrolase (TIGR01450 family)